MIARRDVEAARERIADQLVLTPCTPSAGFADLFAGRAWFKFENLQLTGSFKERGALNRMLLMSDAERARGVLTASAGNHAQGVALHAGRLGIAATIVMPERTPLIKVTRTEAFGARVILHGRSYDEAMEEAERIRAREGLTMIHPFDDLDVIAGQGTVGLELLEQCPGMDVVVVPLGGGGLISGIATALRGRRRPVRVVGVETEALPKALRAREAHARVTIPPGDTIADGIAVRRMGEVTHELVERLVDDIVLVSEEEIAAAVLLLLEREKTVAEPASAATLAAVVSGRLAGLEGKEVVMVLSGGNIDVNLLSRIIERGLIHDGRLAELVVRLQDRPGSLAMVTRLLAEQGVNVLQLAHRRGVAGLALTEAEVELTLETRGRRHVEAVIAALEAAGYRVREGWGRGG